MQGKVTNIGIQKQPHLIVYVRDPEGIILELEQWFSTKKSRHELAIMKIRLVQRAVICGTIMLQHRTTSASGNAARQHGARPIVR